MQMRKTPKAESLRGINAPTSEEATEVENAAAVMTEI